MVACCRGFGSIVALLSRCPFLDVNHQDKEGDTALMLAAQAGHAPLVCLLLHYFAGLDLERRDRRGLTALMKAAVRDRADCVAALLMAGADLAAVDPARGKTALEWAVLTDSFATVQRIRRLQRRPRAEQLSQHFQPQWPTPAGAKTPAAATPSILERLMATLRLSFAPSPEEGGVLDHLVTVTTSLASPFLTTACRTLCPGDPPALGARSKSVPEMLGTAPPPAPCPQPSPAAPDPRVLTPFQGPQGLLSVCSGWLQPRDSPRIILSKAPRMPRQDKPAPRPAGQPHHLALPRWQYQVRRAQSTEHMG
ncbi:photoreceptor ankyrin repeat protein [Sorex araneus]|uniref:photoreceptor ankyrin repeat protein n=1 Tax=Sorex araneus TaxID=42254 RepID=UPI002433376C|nr:photoreceptor ankyrin repeat protein [Sorex araneus]